jgi:hypothetical protein
LERSEKVWPPRRNMAQTSAETAIPQQKNCQTSRKKLKLCT